MVAWKAGKVKAMEAGASDSAPAGGVDANREGVVGRGELLLSSEKLLGRGGAYGDHTGVVVPVVVGVAESLRLRASVAARIKRFVVPVSLVEPERAEHTIATGCCSK